MKINQYHIEKELGEGAFGKVYLYIDEDTNEKFACKKCNKKYLNKKMGGGGSLGS